MPGQSVCFMCLKDKAILYIEYLNPLSTNSPDINMSLKKNVHWSCSVLLISNV